MGTRKIDYLQCLHPLCNASAVNFAAGDGCVSPGYVQTTQLRSDHVKSGGAR